MHITNTKQHSKAADVDIAIWKVRTMLDKVLFRDRTTIPERDTKKRGIVGSPATIVSSPPIICWMWNGAAATLTIVMTKSIQFGTKRSGS